MKKIAIIGGGPTGCTLAILLHRQGHKVAMFYDKSPQELYVGESMIPAIIPILQELGIEDEMKKFSIHKPGATVWVKPGLHAEASFAEGLGQLPTYAYNTNRLHFDTLLFETAKKEGVKIYKHQAVIIAENDSIRFADDTLEVCNDFFEGQADFFIDASGRKRLFSNALKLPVTKGNRMDTALFAHVDGHEFPFNEGDIHMNLASKGWIWRIPVPGKTSIGIVVDKEHLKKYGATAEEQFDNFIQQDEKLKGVFTNIKRTSKIQKYSNYQLMSNRIQGKNWALAGDAAGFLDPVFSSGLHFSMTFASKLAMTFDEKSNFSLADYEKRWKKEIGSWKKMIEIWYNGRLFTNFLYGNDRLDSKFGKWIGKHAVKHFTSVFTGEAINSKFSMGLLRFMTGPLLDFMYFFRLHRYNYKDLQL